MRTSDSINELAAALSAAQGEMKAAPMSGNNTHLKSRYATLNDIIDTARPALAKHGLAYVQVPTSPDNREIPLLGLTTRLMHKSGQWLEDDVFFPVDSGGNRAVTAVQTAGSVITYMRRYALAAILGISSDDDTDGNAPQAKANPQPQRQTDRAQVPPTDKLYADGSFVAPAAVESYIAYVAAHGGKAPENVHNLRNWYKSHKDSQPAPAAELFPPEPPQGNGAYQE